MARARAHPPLAVFINSRLVGRLSREGSGAIGFRYAEAWLGWSDSFPVSLSLPLREERYAGAAVINVFDNLLPDGEALRRRIAGRVAAAGTDAFSLLAAIGRDCVGALQFLPEGLDPGPAGTIGGQPLTTGEVAELLAGLATVPLGLDRDEDFRISLAGAQEKTALLHWKGQWLKPHGATATTHILKPRIGRLANGMDLSYSVENEYLCLKLLDAFGLPTPPVAIADFDDRRALVVERFDRRWTVDGRLLRLPQEDLCQALSVPPTRKYQSDGGPGMRDILQLLRGSDRPAGDVALFLKAALLFWLLGATDGHAKNFSLFIGPGGRFRMTPLYDVLTLQPSLDAGQIQPRQFRLAMSVGRNRHYQVQEILPRHFLQTAEGAGVGPATMRRLFEEIAETTAQRIEAVASALPPDFPEALLESTTAGMIARARLITSA